MASSCGTRPGMPRSLNKRRLRITSPQPHVITNLWLRLLVATTLSIPNLGLAAIDADGSISVTVDIPGYGKARGVRREGVDFFGGIRYAAPPVGKLRFAPPEPPLPWEPALLDASNYGPDCWQIPDPSLNPITYDMSEDCLALNIFTPAGQIHSKKLQPVLVWFHGGAFRQGAANRPEYDGHRLADRGLIVVSINYRLGALGFLVSSSDGLYGNYGLMDQRASLDWIHDNIKSFGGDPGRVTLMGESAGAIMIGLHLMMEGAGDRLFHRVIMQSNALGYTFRSPTVADFIGDGLKGLVDCRDLACLRSERVEDILKAQSALMGVPRSVGDFFTWSPTLTKRTKITIGAKSSKLFTQEEHSAMFAHKDDTMTYNKWAAVNVSQPLKNLEKVPKNIPILMGSNQHEGEIFVYSGFPAPMPRAMYWTFVGVLFRDSAPKVLRHYRGYVDELLADAEELARRQRKEEEHRQYYLENKDQLEQETEDLRTMIEMRRAQYREMGSTSSRQALVDNWARGGATWPRGNFTRWRRQSNPSSQEEASSSRAANHSQWRRRLNPFNKQLPSMKGLGQRLSPFNRQPPSPEAIQIAALKEKERKERRIEREKQRALRKAEQVVIDLRPVLSKIIDDYLFRCPNWHYADKISKLRGVEEEKGKSRAATDDNDVFVFRFSQPTHIPGYQVCWGKSCHTCELPYPFQAMDAIRSNYSMLGNFAQEEAPTIPSYPYTDIIDAYSSLLEAFESDNFDVNIADDDNQGENNTLALRRLLKYFSPDYFREDADEELAADMAERWAAFAKGGSPNYQGSKVEWRPWYPKEKEDTDGRRYGPGDVQWIFATDESDFSDDEDEFAANRSVWSHTAEQHFQRQQVLAALGMEVVEEDVHATKLRRVAKNHQREGRSDNPAFLDHFLFRNSPQIDGLDPGATKEVLRLARDMGVMGIGLTGEVRGRRYSEDMFFPELLELRWPPEGHLIERDCTCDFWDRIGYRY